MRVLDGLGLERDRTGVEVAGKAVGFLLRRSCGGCARRVRSGWRQLKASAVWKRRYLERREQRLVNGEGGRAVRSIGSRTSAERVGEAEHGVARRRGTGGARTAPGAGV